MVKHLQANAGDTGSIAGLGRSYMLESNSACAPQLPSPYAAITEAHVPRVYAPEQEKPSQ